MKSDNTLTERMTKTLADTIGLPFIYKSHQVSEENEAQFTITGQALRHGEFENVEASVLIEGLRVVYWRYSDDAIAMYSKHIGTMELGKDIVISDPSYDRTVWCMTQKDNARSGIWHVDAAIDTIDSWGERLYVLELYHESVRTRQNSLKWKEAGEVGVDTATMSVFDDRYYRRKGGFAEAFEADMAARKRFSDECFDIHNKYIGFHQEDGKNVGVICSSGIGDGGYPLLLAEESGRIVGIQISFM